MKDWQEILNREGGAVWRTAYRILRDRAEAEECFQEAFLAAWEVSGREEVRHWRALLVRLATARAVDRLRRRRRQAARSRATDWESIPDHAPTPPQAAEGVELCDRLRAALGRIPPLQAEAFCLHCLEDWSYREIADQLSVSVDSVGVMLHRARKRLRQLLGDSLEPRRPTRSESARDTAKPFNGKETS